MRRVTLLLVSAALSMAAWLTSAPAAQAGDLLGYDISWPQCPAAVGGFDMPMPPTSTQFVVIGLTNGLAFTWNPCLEDQLQWADDNGIPAQGYTMATFPNADQLAKHGGVGPWGSGSRADQLRNTGWTEALDVVKEMRLYGWDAPVVWIDVEPRPAQPWPSSTAAQRMENRYVLVGLMQGLRESGIGYGFYSYAAAWQAITGSWQLPGVPVWATAGRLDYPTEAIDRCVQPSFSGGPVFLSQWTDGTYDYDRTCPGYAFTDFATSQFIDVAPTHPFAADIAWMADTGVSKGWAQPEGTVVFHPGDPVAREAMAAFLYRYAGSPAYTPPAQSPFVDVPTSHPFYREISWLATTGISSGWQGVGGREFRPSLGTTREAAAAFLYREAGSPPFEAPSVSPFVDVPTSHTFYREISWLAATGISRGWDVGGGRVEFRPATTVAREQMAAFLHRASALPSAACHPFGSIEPQGSTGAPSTQLSSVTGASMRVGQHTCYERAVLEFNGDDAAPGWTAGLTTTLVDGSSGEPVDPPVLGTSVIDVRFGAWYTGEPVGEPPFSGPMQVVPTGYRAIREVRIVGGADGVSQLAVGLDRARPFTVSWLDEPVRLVVDVYAG